MRRWIALLTLAALTGTGITAFDCAMPAAGMAAVAGGADHEHQHEHEHGRSPSNDGASSERGGAGCTFAMMCAGAAVLAPATVSERAVELASNDGDLEPDRAHASASPTRHTPPPRLPA